MLKNGFQLLLFIISSFLYTFLASVFTYYKYWFYILHFSSISLLTLNIKCYFYNDFVLRHHFLSGTFYIWVSYLHIMPFRNIGVPVLHFVFVLVFHRLSTNVTPLFTETHLWFQAFHVHERPKSVNFTAGCFFFMH